MSGAGSPGGRGLRIGLSANFFAPDPDRPVYPHSRLLYAEQHMVRWLSSSGALVYLLPALDGVTALTAADLAADLDGLVLSGGADISPRSYGEEPRRPEWEGQRERDRYEIELFERFGEAGKPTLGICRGAQLVNVALGGTLYQDIATQVDTPLEHRHQERYHRNIHEIDILAGTALAGRYPGVTRARVNSIHHQAVKDLADGLVVEAVSPLDGIVEAFRPAGGAPDGGAAWVAAVQWHPEFFHLAEGEELLDTAPVLDDFLDAASRREQI